MKHALHGRPAASYARLAASDTAGIHAQHNANATSAAVDGYHVPDDDQHRFSDDGVSGFSHVRPAWTELLRQVTSGVAPFDRVYVQDLTRIGRWGGGALAGCVWLFREYGVELVAIDNHPRGGVR
jgi:hypothetical protein